MPEDAEIHDPLDDSPILEEVLGEALPRLRKFHVKLFTEGEPRGLIGPRDVGILWERHILNLRFFEGKTQMEVSAEVGISQAQVSRLEKSAINRMKKDL